MAPKKKEVAALTEKLVREREQFGGYTRSEIAEAMETVNKKLNFPRVTPDGPHVLIRTRHAAAIQSVAWLAMDGPFKEAK